MTIINTYKSRLRIMKVNSQEIVESNFRMLTRLIHITIFLSCIPIFVGIFDYAVRKHLAGFAFTLTVCLLLALVFGSRRMRKYSLWGIYLLLFSIYALSLYLSLICFPNRHATTALLFFCVMPMIYIDSQLRTNSILLLLFLLHTLLSYHIKGPIIGRDDALGGLIGLFLGIETGDAVLASQLSSIEAHRQLTLEKETDVLTGLSNRRKLLETMIDMESSGQGMPSGILMIDIDHFKEVNDANGHAVGDLCLKSFGAMLLDFQRIYNITFYRYGGEEFVGLAFVKSEHELLTLADSIRLAASQRQQGGISITVSIGEVWCAYQQGENLEQWVDRADKALYDAKSKGRNSLFRYRTKDGSTIPYTAQTH